MDYTIRDEAAGDRSAVAEVNRLAFGGRDDEARLVERLREGGYARVSMVAEAAGQVVGHVLFSDLPIVTVGGTVAALALAPMAVVPEFQGRRLSIAGGRHYRALTGLCPHRLPALPSRTWSCSTRPTRQTLRL